MSVHYCTREFTERRLKACAPQQITRQRARVDTRVETAANRSGGDTMPVRKPMTG